MSSKRKSRDDYHVYPPLPVPHINEVKTVMDARESINNEEIAKFFKVCYNIDPPFKVLQDASFISYILRNNITKDVFAKMLPGVVHQLYTTRHTVDELKEIAEKYQLDVGECIEKANGCLIARCGNKLNCVNDAECIEVLVGNDNPMGFIVASRDKKLKKKLKQMSGVPLVRCRKGSIKLCLPYQGQIDHAFDRRNNGPRQQKFKKRNRATAERKLKEKQQKREQDVADFTESVYASAFAREVKNSSKWKEVPDCIMSADSEALNGLKDVTKKGGCRLLG